MDKIDDINEFVEKLQKYIDQLNDVLIKDIPKEMRETNKQYKDLIHIASELNIKLAAKR